MTGVRIQTRFRHLAVVIALLLISFACEIRAAEAIWPTAGWRTSTPEEQGTRSDLLADMLERIRWNEYPIHSVLIVRNGYLILDAHFHSRWKGQRHANYSVTKSVTAALIGIAIDKGYIAGVRTPVLDFFPERAIANIDARKRALTLEHLLTMTTGLKCRDSYLYGWDGYMKMRQSKDWAQFVLDLPMEAVPGEKFEYCNGASFLLSAVLAKATKTDTFEFAKTHLFAPLGIKDVSWSKSTRGIRKGCCGLSLTAHDMAKFGLLFLNRGKWNGQQVISSAWVDRSTRHHVDVSMFDHYGYQWWRDASGYYMAVGYKGQLIFVIPRKNMVAVFTGGLERSTFFAPKTLLDKFIIPAAKSDAPLPPNVKQRKRLAKLIETLAETQEARDLSKRRYVWQTSADGTAHDGIFIRRNRPAFQFRYPLGSLRDETLGPSEIMRMRTSSGVVISASVMAIPGGVAPADAGPVSYSALLRKLGSDVEAVSNRRITLSDGTVGYRTDFRWNSRGLKLRTVVISALKDRRWVFVATHHRTNINLAGEIAKSFEFSGAR